MSVNMNWYSGTTVLEALGEFRPAHDPVDASFRMPVQGIFNLDNKRVVLGKIAAGKIKPGERVTIMPGELKGEVKSIEVFGCEKREALAGESIGLILDNGAKVARGQVIAEVDDVPKPGKKLTAHLFWMDEKPLLLKDHLTIKCATAETGCKIEKIKERLNSSTLQIIGKNAERLEEAEAADVIISTDEPIVFEEFTAIPELGRFVLQKQGRVCAGGVVCAE